MSKPAGRQTQQEVVPPLRDGDRMEADEFLRRYVADKIVYSAELLKGVVHVTRWREVRDGREIIVPGIPAEGHGGPHAKLLGWLGMYHALTPGTSGLGPTTTILPSQTTALEPDGQLRILPESGGYSVGGADGFIHGRPELIIEVSHLAGGRHLGPKYEAFEADGVPEYLVWRTEDSEVEWFVLKRKKYTPLKPHADGTLRSETFPGLWLDPAALLAGDVAKVLAVVQKGIASPEHAAFVAKLQKAAKRKKK